jgi:D-alanyl-D-alanine carboxypeptidase/D-alanyl-D-alanine-endopeptidase (penicillin-binding protein 4)
VGIVAAILPAAAVPASAGRSWTARIDRLVRHRAVGVAVEYGGRLIYQHNASVPRTPASNEKLLLSMALFDAIGPSCRIRTTAAVAARQGGTVQGNLWIVGNGDPTLTTPGAYARSLRFGPTRVGVLARRIVAAGVTRITGSVIGDNGYFRHDWYAPGWEWIYKADAVALPTALTYRGNTYRGRHVRDPERRLAAALTNQLVARGVTIGREPGAGRPPPGTAPIASVSSKPLSSLVRYMDRESDNFFAEVLGKRLGAERLGAPGSIAKGARALASWARRHGVRIVAHDSSGLSSSDRVSPLGLVRLLGWAERQPWGARLRASLAAPGQGTLVHRLSGVRLRAKTGTLPGVSALSGWVWLTQRKAWARFSILSRGRSSFRLLATEDAIVRILARSAR